MAVFKFKWRALVAAAPLLWLVANRLQGEWKSVQQSPHLLAAVQAGDRIAALSALEDGANTNTKNSHQCTPLMLAAARGDIDMVRSLLDSGATVNSRDERGMTPLMRATAAGNPDLVALLIFWKAEVNVRSADGMTALQLARELAAGTEPKDAGPRPVLPTQRRQFALIARMLEQVGARE